MGEGERRKSRKVRKKLKTEADHTFASHLNYFAYTTLNCWGMINLGFVLTGVICYYF